MILENILKEHVIKAIQEIDENGIEKGAHSSTYDVVYNDKRYPPKLVVSLASKHANGEALPRDAFSGGEGTPAFQLLERLGYEIDTKKPMKEVIKQFLEQSKTDSLKTKHYINTYKSLKIKVSFGAGNVARIPWIALLKEPNKVQDGIYPVFLYYKEVEKLVLAYGVSETNTSHYAWNNDNAVSIKIWFNQNFQKTPERYGKSTIKAVYDINSIDYDKIQKDLDDIIKEYELLNFDLNMVNDDPQDYATGIIEKYLKEFSEVSDSWFSKQSWLEPRYLFFKEFFNPEKINHYQWSDFQKIKNNLHSFTSLALAGANALGNPNLEIEKYQKIFKYIISRQDDIATTINNLLEKNGIYSLPYFGESTITELIEYAFPNEYIVYNSRTESALNILGIKLEKVRGEKIGGKFKRFNDLAGPIGENYERIVGRKTKTSIPLELDQFFSWLYETKKVEKPLKDLITSYKNCIQESQLKDESYKWQFIQENKGKPDLNAENFGEEIKSIKWNNLVYAMSGGVLNHLAKEKVGDLRNLFKDLFDESKLFNQRIKDWDKNVLKLYRKINGEHAHHQDERAISVYLTLHNPEQYTFYKSSYYTKFCELLGEKPKKKNQKYVHYMELVNMFVNDYISKDQELIDLVKSFIPEDYDGSNNLLVAQDILYQILDKDRDINYWVFQGNPKHYDIKSSIKDNALKTWSVSAHKDKIKEGDKIILWVTGSDSGCYALGEVKSDVYEGLDDEIEMKYYTDKSIKEKGNRVDISLTHNLIEAPITKNQIDSVRELSKLNAGNQGTNFTATKEEYLKLLEMAETKNVQYWLYAPGENATKWEEFYDEGIIGLGWEEIGDLRKYESRDDLREALRNVYGGKGDKKNDVSANDDFVNKMNIGDIIIAKKGRGKLLGYGVVTSDYYFDDNRIGYKSYRKIEWKKKGNWKVDFSLVLKTLTDITKYYSDDTESVTYYDELLNIMEQNTIKESEKMKFPLNTILYGPPGTGKTYSLKKDYFSKYISKETSLTTEKNFENVVKECSWWQVIAIALLELGKSKVSGIYENKWVQQKAKLSSSKTIRPTLWGQLQSHTIENCEYVNVKSKQSPLIFNKDENSSWEIIENEVKEQSPELYEIIDSVNKFTPNPDKEIKRYKFVTFHQSFSYEDFIEGIKPILPEGEEVSEDLGYKIENGVFKSLCNEAKNDLENQYAIFIDEINRGNVSAIFGELITLIETDKRTGCDNEVKVVLPYSKEEFSVPPNLDIYGTMNTADRSIEALDTALRRRFSFVEMMPDYEVISKLAIDSINLKEVLKTINDRVELLVDRDHTIGHSYFIDIDTKEKLCEAFNDKITPLLQEYFYGDYGKIGLVLGEGFVKKSETKDIAFANFKYDDSDDFKTPKFNLIKMNEGNIITAIKTLLGKVKESSEE